MRAGQLAAGAIALPAALILGLASDAPKQPAGLPPVTWPRANRYSPAKAELGRVLYFDKRLSADGTISCATCHDPKFAFTDGAAVSTGIRRAVGEGELG